MRKNGKPTPEEEFLCCMCGLRERGTRYVEHLGKECDERAARNRRERGEPRTLPMKG